MDELSKIKVLIPGYDISLVSDLGNSYFVKVRKPGEDMIGGTTYEVSKDFKTVEPIVPFEEPYYSKVFNAEILYVNPNR